VKSYLGNLLHFLGQLVETQMIRSASVSARSSCCSNTIETDSLVASRSLLRIVITATENLIPFFEPFGKLASKFLKALLKIWASADQDTRIIAFLRLRQLAIEMPESHNMLEAAYKGVDNRVVSNNRAAW